MFKFLLLTYVTLCQAGILQNIIDFTKDYSIFSVFKSVDNDKVDKFVIDTIEEDLKWRDLVNSHNQNVTNSQSNSNTMHFVNMSEFMEIVENNYHVENKNSTQGKLFFKVNDMFSSLIHSLKQFFSSLSQHLSEMGIKLNNGAKNTLEKINEAWSQFLEKFKNASKKDKKKMVEILAKVEVPDMNNIDKQSKYIPKDGYTGHIINKTAVIAKDIQYIITSSSKAGEKKKDKEKNLSFHLKIALGCICILVVLGAAIFILTIYYRKRDNDNNEEKHALYEKTQSLQFNSMKEKQKQEVNESLSDNGSAKFIAKED